MSVFDISLEIEVDGFAVDEATLLDLAARVMAGEDVADGTALAVVLTGDDEIRELNREFLGIDEPTDVLSFPDQADGFVEAGDGPPLLGDIAISLPTAAWQAGEMGHSLAHELAHLLVHGVLHLRGYDHVDSPEEEARMRSREEHYLGDLGAFHRH